MGLISKSAFATWLSCMMSLSASAIAAESPVLPDPLTLDYALSLADEAHPDLLLKNAGILEAEAKRKSIEGDVDYDLDLDISVYDTDEVSARTARRQDHVRAGFIVSKTFYDFGHTDTLLSGADEFRYSRELAYYDARGLRRLEIMAAYFNVLLADLKFSLYNEAMSIGYVNYDKEKDRRELGQRTDLDVVKRDSEYQRLRYLRYQSENRQRETRVALAEVLNRPGQLSSNLAIPKLDVLNRKLPEYELLQQQALEKNIHINALRHDLRAAEKDLSAARDSDGPELKGRLEAYTIESDLGSTNDFRAELSLIYNLYNPEKNGNVAAELARLYIARAQLQKAESTLRQDLLKTWHKIEELTVKRDEMAVLLELRELQLEKSRALYEMEVKADLGFSMTELTDIQHKSAQTDYQLVLEWYQLDLLAAKIKLDFKQKINQPAETH